MIILGDIMDYRNDEHQDERIKRLVEIGAIFDAMGVNNVEIAKKLKEHLENCPGGRECVNKVVIK
jgi:hypothetical protein